MLVQRVAPLLATSLDHHFPSSSERALDKGRERLIERRLGQMIEQNFRHAS
jgi:hypothetical protein